MSKFKPDIANKIFSWENNTMIKMCDHEKCDEIGKYKAPKSRLNLNSYYYFCLNHIKKYNKSWDFYKGLSVDDIELSLRKDIVWDRLVEFANIRLSGICDLGSADIAKQTYFYEPELTALIKYAVNFALPTDAAEEFVTDFVTSEGYTLKQLTSEWFLKDEEILLLDGADMEIGMHGVSHRSFSSIGEDRIIEEIHHSSTYLRNLVGYPPSWFSSPFGGGDLADAGGLVKKALKEINVFASVTQNKGFVTGASDVYSLPRFDCMYLPPLGNELSDILKKGQGFFDENQ